MFETLLFFVAAFSAMVAAISGFGIGSLITPVLALQLSTKVAIAVVAIPHFIATALRFWMMRKKVDKKILLSFGLMSAVGGITGEFLFASFATPFLTLIFGILLMFSGFMGATGLSAQMRFHGWIAWVAGFASGCFGGMVGNQGGIRSAAMLGFPISKESFVATATAIGLIVDLARMPIYFWMHGEEILSSYTWVAIAFIAVVFGTFLGTKILHFIPENIFRRSVTSLIFLLGIVMTLQGLQEISSR
jgi:uncharacterized protein